MLFPAREWAIRIPVILLLVFFAIVGTFIGVTLIRAENKKGVVGANGYEHVSQSDGDENELAP